MTKHGRWMDITTSLKKKEKNLTKTIYRTSENSPTPLAFMYRGRACRVLTCKFSYFVFKTVSDPFKTVSDPLKYNDKFKGQ
jgi:hypothetical protein